MADRRRTRPIAATLAAAALATLAAGCTFTAAATSTALLVPAGVAAGGASAYAAMGARHGPHIALHNDTDVTFLVRYWVAKVDNRQPEGFTDQRTADHLALTLPPGHRAITNCGRPYWPTAPEDAVVWIRLQPMLDDTTPGDTAWFELPRPAPDELRITGRIHPDPIYADEDLDPKTGEPLDPDATPIGALEPFPIAYTCLDRDCELIPLPRSVWIEQHDGAFPIRAANATP